MTKLTENILFDVDAYKVSMSVQYPPGTEYVSSYIEARGTDFNFPVHQNVPFIGLQHILDVLTTKATPEMVQRANALWTQCGEPFPLDGWMTIATEFDGKLPLEIKALPEGSIVGTGVPMVQVVNTDPRFFWLTTWVETKLLRVWYPVTVATLSACIKKQMEWFADQTQDQPFVDFSLHDFGSRGASSSESSSIGGMAHMLNFRGTDTFNGLMHIVDTYGSDGVVGGSIPAAEHSTLTSWGRENEVDAFRNMINKFGSGTFAVVSDSYDYFKALSEYWGGELKDDVLEMEGNLVIRPDSGDPVEIVQKSVQTLWEIFGGEINSKGFKVLNDKVRVIQGDGVDYHTIYKIMTRLKNIGFSTENVAFGMGGALLQQVNRDNLKFAMKASAAKVNGEWVDVYKDPITDSGKRSKRGRQQVRFTPGEGFVALEYGTLAFTDPDMLQTVFLNGEVVNRLTWDDVMENNKKYRKTGM